MDDADERAGSSDLADLGVRGRTAGPTHPLAAWRFQRAARSGGASESQDGKFSVSIDALGDEFGAQCHRSGGCDVPEVDLVRRPLSEALVWPFLVEPPGVGAELRLDCAERPEQVESSRVLDLHGLPPPLDDGDGPVAVHGPVARPDAQRAHRLPEHGRRSAKFVSDATSVDRGRFQESRAPVREGAGLRRGVLDRVTRLGRCGGPVSAART